MNDQVEFYCSFAAQGCKEEIPLLNLFEHEHKCEYKYQNPSHSNGDTTSEDLKDLSLDPPSKSDGQDCLEEEEKENLEELK